jgi:phage-related protein
MNATGRSASRGAQQVGHASSDMSESLDEVGDSMENAARSADESFEQIGDAAGDGGREVEESAQKAKKGVEDSTNQLSASVIAKAQLMAQAIAGAVKMAANGAKNLIQGTVEAYSSYEQNLGGVAKLYGAGGQSIQQYAASVGKSVTDVTAEYGRLSDAQKLVVKNAKQAYKTAGMDANTYMENATQFSASLINSLGGDTVKAAEQTDKAMRLISDNVNTFGSNTEDVSNAIKGLSRDNFTMLDNLKLGYAGTKEGMQQLIDDANAYGKTIGMTKELSMDSFSDMIDAIQLIQQKQGIAGTTAREAATTIEGSLNMTKAAWSNLLTTLGSGEGTEDAFRALLESAGKFASNVKPVIGRALEGMGQVLLEEGPKLVVGLADGIANGIPEAIPKVIEVVKSIGAKFGEHTDELKSAGKKLLEGLLTGISEATGIDIDVSAITAVFGKIGELGGGALDSVVGLFQKAGPPVAAFVGSLVDLGSTIAGSVLTAFENLAPIVESIVGAFIDFGSTVISAVSPAIKGLSSFLSEHGEIIEAVVAGVAAVVGGFMALEGIITVLITVVDAISVAVGVFNAVLNANPIMLIVTGIAALVAAFIYLWNNCESFRQVFIDLWDNIKEVVSAAWDGITSALSAAWEWISTTATTVFGAIGEFFTGLWNGIKSTAESVWNGISSFLSGVWNGIQNVVSTVVNVISTIISTYFNIYKTIITTVFNAIKTVVTTVWNGISTAITTVVTTIQNVISTGFNAVKTAVSTVFNAVKTAIEKPFKAAYDTVKGIVNKLKSIFNFSWKLPDIQVPKFKIQGGTFPYGLGGKGKFPQIDIEWHAKAMNAPMLLTKPTIFGMMGDKYLAGGEAGPEVVSGVNPLLNMMRNAASSGNGRRDAMLSMIVELLSQYLPEISTGQDPEALFQAFDRRLGEAMI